MLLEALIFLPNFQYNLTYVPIMFTCIFGQHYSLNDNSSLFLMFNMAVLGELMSTPFGVLF